MRYQAKPVNVDAHVITSVGPKDEEQGAVLLFLDCGTVFRGNVPRRCSPDTILRLTITW